MRIRVSAQERMSVSNLHPTIGRVPPPLGVIMDKERSLTNNDETIWKRVSVRGSEPSIQPLCVTIFKQWLQNSLGLEVWDFSYILFILQRGSRKYIWWKRGRKCTWSSLRLCMLHTVAPAILIKSFPDFNTWEEPGDKLESYTHGTSANSRKGRCFFNLYPYTSHRFSLGNDGAK